MSEIFAPIYLAIIRDSFFLLEALDQKEALINAVKRTFSAAILSVDCWAARQNNQAFGSARQGLLE
jgi:hypothetical protein